MAAFDGRTSCYCSPNLPRRTLLRPSPSRKRKSWKITSRRANHSAPSWAVDLRFLRRRPVVITLRRRSGVLLYWERSLASRPTDGPNFRSGYPIGENEPIGADAVRQYSNKKWGSQYDGPHKPLLPILCREDGEPRAEDMKGGQRIHEEPAIKPC